MAHEDPLTGPELLLYDHLRHLDCSVPVDPADPDDCASVAIEVIRFLREHGLLNEEGPNMRGVLAIEAIEAEAVANGRAR